jgi:hypothetical protein
MDDLSDAIPLRQILVRIVYILDGPEEGLGNRVVVLESCVELKQVSDGCLTLCEIVAGGDVDRIEDVVIEVLFVRTNARLFKRINCNSCS